MKRTVKRVDRREALRKLAKLGVLMRVAQVGAVAPQGGLFLNFADYGACDGFTDDSAAFSSVLSLLSSAGGGVLIMPPATIAMTLTNWPTFSIPANVEISGTVGSTRILLSTNGGVSDRCFATNAGNNVSFDGMTLVRQSDFPLVFLTPGPYDGLRLNRCTVDGQKSAFPDNYVHGICLDGLGPKSRITVADSTWTGLDYAVLQSNTTTDPVRYVVVDNCTFNGNYADDLCFNAPNSTMSDILVTRCSFLNNQSLGPREGFGVDFAHVTRGAIRDCRFHNYFNEGIHVEDYSTDIVINANRLVLCGTGLGGGITVMTGCSNVVVSGNTLDARSNTNTLYAIAVVAAGVTSTPGGRPPNSPSKCTIADNTILCGQHYQGIYVEDGNAVQGNKILGDSNPGTGLFLDGGTTVTDGNTITGFRHRSQFQDRPA